MTSIIDLSKYRDKNDKLVGETMEVDIKAVKIFIASDKYPLVRPGIFLFVRSGEGGLVGYVGSKITKTKYGGEFIPIYFEYGEDAKLLYGDIESEYIYTVNLHPLYEIDRDGAIKASFTLYVKPHQPVYILDEEDVRRLLLVDGELNLSFLLYVDLNDYVLCRNLATYIYGILKDSYGLEDIFMEFLRYGRRNGTSLDVIINVFEEVGRHA